MPARKPDESPIYQLKVTLKESKPPIWRRIQVRGSTTLAKLHPILQVVMGWTDSHLHQFIVGGVYYGVPDPEWDMEVKSERRVQLAQVLPQVKNRLVYEYDFGDSWHHEIVVEKILPPAPGMHYPLCLTGKRACPPEDVGGMWGYTEFLEAMRDPKHPDHRMMRDWVGGAFDRDAFDLQVVNQALRYL
jgi:hypothetical protein